MADMFNTGKSGKKLYASPWDKLRNLVGSGLHTLDRVAPQVSMAVRKMGNSGGEANLLSKGLVNHIDTKIGTPGFFFKEVVPLIVDSRLQGIAERYVANGDLPSSLKVKRLMSDAEFAAKSADPKVQQALKIYRDTIEKGLSESHASNEGVFSDALGPLDTYYPLTRLDEAGKPVGTAYGKSSPLLRKPGNPRNKQATGFGLDYDVTPQGFQRAVKGMVYTNNRGAMVKALEDSGIAQIVDAKDAANIHSVVVNGIEWDAKPVATGVRGKVAMVPSGMAKELSHALENGLEASSAHGFVNTLNHIALQGLAEPVIHSLNLLGTIWSEPLAGGLNPATRVLGNTPFVSRFSKLGELLTTKTLDESAVRDLQDMARIGLLPGKTQGVTTAYTKAGRQAAKNIGVEAKYDLSPSLYGQNGIDTKARLYMYRLAKATGANTDADIAKIVNRLPEYNKAAEGILERGSKRAGTGPFYTAGQTMIRNGIDAWRLSYRLPEGMSKLDKAKVLTAHHIGNGVLGFTGVWVAANMIVTGKPPWENGSRYGEINLGNGKAVNVGLFYPVEMRGARVLGIKGAHDTKSAYPDAANFQMMEAGMKDSINGLLHPLTGPVAKMGSIALTGMEPSVSGFRDYITGKSSLNLYRGAPDTGSSQTKTNLLYGLANVNSFGLQFLEKIGLVKPVFEGKAAEDSGPFAAMVELSGLRPVVEYDQQKKKLNLMKQKFKVMRADIKREALGK